MTMKKNRHLDAKGKGEIVYDLKYDTLTFRTKNRDYSKSVEFLNFSADVDKEGYVTGITIEDASQVFGVDKRFMKEIAHAEFHAEVKKGIISVKIGIVIKKRNKLMPLTSSEESHTQTFSEKAGKGLLEASVECATA